MKRHCRVCGAEYEYCYSCEKVHSWRTLTDTADHYYILNVLMEYQGDHDAVKAYHALSKRGVNIRETDGLLPSVKMLMVEIASKVKGMNGTRKKAVPAGQAVVEKKDEKQLHSTDDAEVSE